MEQLEKLKFLLTGIRLFQLENKEAEILELLSEIFDRLTQADYDEAYRIRLQLGNLSMQHHNLFVASLLIYFDYNISSILNKPRHPDKSLAEISDSYIQLGDELQAIIDPFLRSGEKMRISESIIPSTAFPTERREELLSFVLNSIQYAGENYIWSEDEIYGVFLFLPIGRQLSHLLDKLELFYAIVGVVVEKLNISQRYQLCRDLGEEVCFASFQDNRYDWGYFILFKTFNSQLNVSTALIYLNACIATITKEPNISESLFKFLLVSIQRFFRNIKHIPRSDTIQEYLVTHGNLDEYEYFDVTNVHLLAHLGIRDNAVVITAYKYLIENREFLFRADKSVATPLLNTIHTIKYVFGTHPDISLLDEYISVLESIVGVEDSELIRNRIYLDSANLKTLYLKELIAIQETRDAEDIASESHTALVLAEKLILQSIERQDANAFLLAMFSKADYSWIFIKPKSIPEFNVVDRDSLQRENPSATKYEEYANYVMSHLILEENESCLWLAEAEANVFSLSLERNGFTPISPAEEWQLTKMYKWLDNDFADLLFDETMVVSGQVEQYTEDYQTQDLERIRERVSFTKVHSEASRSMLLIKDITLSPFPHNLILDTNGEFLSRMRPITCLPSTEWYIENIQNPEWLEDNFTTSMWIPTESGDMALNLLLSKLEDSIQTFNIDVMTSELPKQPLNSDVNIIIAHGASDIADFHSFFTSDESTITELKAIVDTGKIALLFVCHSGSMKKALFREKVLSLIRNFLENGYQSIVAPFWSLHTSIPPIWLPEFLDSVNSGHTVSEAVYIANSRIFNMNKNPGAWACLHLYGNAHLKLAKDS